MHRTVVTLFFALATLNPATAQKAAFNVAEAQNAPLGLPSPMDKFLALDIALGEGAVKWSDVLKELSVNADLRKLTVESDVSMALGVRIADGVMAVKARDANALNDCASDIEALAKKLQVTDEELDRAKKARALANKGQWLMVFWELGCLQVDIMRSLNKKGNERRRTLIITAGWMQGAHYAAYVIDKRYTPALSNCLREPMLVKAMQEELAQLPAATKAAKRPEQLAKALAEIHGIVNIPLDGAIPRDQVARMNSLLSELCTEFVQ
jgi:hypothetical protein